MSADLVAEELSLAGRNKLATVRMNGWGFNCVQFAELASGRFGAVTGDGLRLTDIEPLRVTSSEVDYRVTGVEGLERETGSERYQIGERTLPNDLSQCFTLPPGNYLYKKAPSNKGQIVVMSGDRFWFCNKTVTCFDFFIAHQDYHPATRSTPAQVHIPVSPILKLEDEFMRGLRSRGVEVSCENADRLFHSHGHTVDEIFALRYSQIARLPDAVIYPQSHQEVEHIVKLAVGCNVCLIPFGGGTNVTQAVCCPAEETRMIATVVVTRMNKVLWLDKENLIGCFEAGLVGSLLEARLAEQGYTLGHEPDSSDFSTVGGWIATRCSGMKRSTYGNIDELLTSVTVVTAKGTLVSNNMTYPEHPCVLSHPGVYSEPNKLRKNVEKNCQKCENNSEKCENNSEKNGEKKVEKYFENADENSTYSTPIGPANRPCYPPRLSCGPDLRHFVLGSEGIFGIITQAIFKIRPAPKVKRYGSVVFPSFSEGAAFVRELAYERVKPTSVRLLDNKQLQFGLAMRPMDIPIDGSIEYHPSLERAPLVGKCSARLSQAVKTSSHQLLEAAKNFFVQKIKGFDPTRMVVCTLLLEGNHSEVGVIEKITYEIGKKHKGLPGGQALGMQGYALTFLIAYIRDFIMDYGWIFESFETSVPWSKVEECCDKVKDRIERDCASLKLRYKPISMVRIAQSYDEGACLYFYFGFCWLGLPDPISAYSYVEDGARDEIFSCGGCISHHHGVGKLRKKFVTRSCGALGLDTLRGLKKVLDPTNVFGSGNLI